jgi:hypothetical protein
MPVPLREIVYTLSPYQQEIMMKGIGKVPAKIGKFFYDVSILARCSMLAGMQRLTSGLGIAEKRAHCRLWHRAVRPHRVSRVMQQKHPSRGC